MILEIPIIKRLNSPVIKTLKTILLSCLILVVIGAVIDQPRIIAFSFILIVPIILFFSIKKNYYKTGVLRLDDKTLTLIFRNSRESFELEELTNIQVKYYGYAGEETLNPKTLTPKDGTGNFIQFTLKNTQQKHELLLHYNTLQRLKKKSKEIKTNLGIELSIEKRKLFPI